MKYFLDTSILIDLTNKKEKAIKKIQELLDEKDSELYINNFVRLEVLRGVPFSHSKVYRDTQDTLSDFEILQLNDEIYEDTISFSRFCRNEGLNLKGKCESIDFLHFMTAKYYDLKMISNDKGFDRLEQKYQDYQKNEK